MKLFLPMKEKQFGQAILILLLVMAVILTVGLSVVSRSVTDIKISQQSQESARSFWVAQAGLEEAIRANAAPTGTLNDVTYSVDKADLGGGTEFIFPKRVEENDPVTLWLVDHDANGNLVTADPTNFYKGKLTFYWGEGDASNDSPALEASLIYADGDDFLIKRYVFDPFSGRQPPTGFSPAESEGTVLGKTFAFSSGEINLNLFNQPYFFRLKLLFNGGIVGVSSKNSALKSQGNCWTSTAVIEESQVTSKLNECRLWSVTPQIFDYALFSEGSI